MRHYVLGKHGWSAAGLCLLLPLCAPHPAHAAPARSQGQLAIGSPLAGTLVAGRISVSVAYDSGLHRISAFTIFVDDQIHSSRDFTGASSRGIQYLDLDTRSLADGNHTLKIVAKGPRGVMAIDQVNITVRNGVAGGADIVPPLVQFRNLTEGATLRGKVTLDVLAEDNTTQDLLVSIFVNQFPRLIKSSPPYKLELNTAEFLDPMTGTGKITLEAWAYDKFNNLGKARPVVVRVEPEGASENQTKAPASALSRPMSMDMEPAMPTPIKAPMIEDVVIPVRGMRGEMPPGRVDPRLPQTASSSLTGRPVAARTGRTPGARPSQPRMAKASPIAVDPEFAPVGSASRAGLAGDKTTVPYLRPRTVIDAPDAGSEGPGVSLAPTMSAGGAPVAASRIAAPPAAVRVAPARVSAPVTRQTVMAKAPSLGPEPVMRVPLPAPRPAAARAAAPTARSEEPLTPYPGPRPSAVRGDAPLKFASRSVPSVTASDMGAPLPMESTMPRQSPDGTRATMPSAVRREPAPAVRPVQVAKTLRGSGPLIVVVDPKAPRRKDGKMNAEVFRLNSRPRLPKDRIHQVRRDETLETIAKHHGVTPRSLLVANGLAAPRVRAGSILKVPGTFDIVMNDRQIAFDVAPRVENGLPIAPFRQIFEHAGGVVVWNAESREIRAANEQKDIKLRIGSKEARVNQVVVVMDREAFLDSGRTIVPVSFMEKALDLKADYDVKNGTIMLVRK